MLTVGFFRVDLMERKNVLPEIKGKHRKKGGESNKHKDNSGNNIAKKLISYENKAA